MPRVVADDEDTPGLAGERTDLAWSRSGVAVLAAVAAIGRRVLRPIDEPAAELVVVVLLAAGAVAWALAVAHARVVAATTLAGRAHADPAKLRFVALGTAAFAGAALVLALLPSP